MTLSSTESQGPQGILLATDFSAQSDRAEIRAVERAKALGARLNVLTVMEEDGAKPLDLKSADPEVIAAELRSLHGQDLDLNVTVEEGEAWSLIIGEAVSRKCTLIVLGPAGPCGLQERLLGSTAERVVHAAPMPVLTVRRRARGPYRQVIVAVDFSASSRHALIAAANVLPEAQFLLLHAYRVAFTGFQSFEANEPELRRQAETDLEAFLRSLDSEVQLKDRVCGELHYGTPDEVVGPYVAKHASDLVVIGAHGTGGAFDKILGSTAEHLLSHLPCDVMSARLPGGGRWVMSPDVV